MDQLLPPSSLFMKTNQREMEKQMYRVEERDKGREQQQRKIDTMQVHIKEASLQTYVHKTAQVKHLNSILIVTNLCTAYNW